MTVGGVDAARLSQLLGRRIRPWWGVAPGRLLMRGGVQGTVAALVMVGARRVRSDGVDLASVGLAEQRDRVDSIVAIVMILAVVLLLHSLVRVAVGGVDLVARRRVDGVVVSLRERTRGDVLPGIVQRLIWSRGDRLDLRRSRLQLTLETADGLGMWQLSPRHRRGLEPGQRVELTTTALLGHVRGVRRVESVDG